MVVKVRSLFALLSLAVAAASAGKAKTAGLPPSFPRCSLKDAHRDECLRQAVQAVIPELVKGVPSLGVYSIDPLDIVEANIGAQEGPVALNLDFHKLKISGLHTAQVLSLSLDPKTYHITMRAKVKNPLRLDGNYKIAGKVLVLPIQGEGLCSLKLDDVTADIRLAMHEVSRGGVKFLAVDKLALSFETSRLHMKFDNLFNGNKDLGDNMNRFLNENWPEILKELKPSIDETFGAAFQAIANRIFHKVPLNSVFLP